MDIIAEVEKPLFDREKSDEPEEFDLPIVGVKSRGEGRSGWGRAAGTAGSTAAGEGAEGKKFARVSAAWRRWARW